MNGMDETGVKSAFGIRLRVLRTRRGWTQETLAAASGLDVTYVSSCERGHRNVGLVNICRLADALDVSPSSLFSEWHVSSGADE